MGCYDEVSIRCPHCEAHLNVQSKAGRCNLQTFPSRRVPLDIAEDILERKIYCPRCMSSIRFQTPAERAIEVIPYVCEDD